MNKTRIYAIGLAILLIFLMSGIAGAGSSANYDINWQVLSSGGTPSTAGNVSLNGSLGQTAIGLSSASSIGLSSGYWYGSMMATSGSENVYLPIVIKE